LCMPSRLLLSVRVPSHAKPGALRYTKFMASDMGKKLMQIDVSSDTVCPWCFVGKKNLERAMEQTKDKYNFEVRWHPFFLNPDAPKEGIRKSNFYKMKFGPVQFERATSRMTEVLSFDLAMVDFIHIPENGFSCLARVCFRYFKDLDLNMTCRG